MLVKCLSNVYQCLSKEGKDNGSQMTVRLERAAQPATTGSGAMRAGCQASGRTYVRNRQFIQCESTQARREEGRGCTETNSE